MFSGQTELTKILEATTGSWIALVAVLVVLVVCIWLIKGWFGDNDDPTNVDEQMLQQLSELKRQGQLSSEEFRSIKGRLSDRLQTRDATSKDDVVPKDVADRTSQPSE